ncbi:methyltransferase family protein [Pseudobutyrivibrio xylanivorans]|uniref:Protein-S-isoprenylcysteine O-methyltransferase Ste14 n=1 Tax=Pseudobutyrivibrio xylanivorans TaxID=185007 RepID=A0A1G5S358_PSEXY|nr:isoprenylcysteine carboxylmethyltransferase family protein [Pseudobutyrivibrio xylanivorans]SCZ80280.1 Protein-S-isoprenylcysteine O-methyltransferase Ste14 [Pseudobutyrivibrio xylanivorans]
MEKKLIVQALVKVVCGIVLLGLLLFVPAGTLNYWQGLFFMAILFIPMIVAGFVMMFKCPELLKKRLNVKEEQSEQRTVILLSGLMFIAAFLVAGLNFRFGWLILPDWVTYLFTVVFLIAYLLYAEVLRENEYLSRTVEVQENQKVVDTGLYGVVRHPMYMTTLLLFLSMPLVLGSLFSFVIMLVYIPIISKRIHNEEQVLAEGLAGYREYMDKVKYQVIPFIW